VTCENSSLVIGEGGSCCKSPLKYSGERFYLFFVSDLGAVTVAADFYRLQKRR